MSVRSGQSITTCFTTRRFDTGAAVNADSLPTGTLYVNGTADAASVTVTNITTGRYKAQVTMPTLSIGDLVDLNINATVNSITDNGIVWNDTKDFALDTSGQVSLAAGAVNLAAVNADAYPLFGIIESGTGQSATSTGFVLRSAAAFPDSTLVGSTLMVFGSTQGYWQSRTITANLLSGDACTVDAWTVTPSGTLTYYIIDTPPASVTNLPAVNVMQVNSISASSVMTINQHIGTTQAVQFTTNAGQHYVQSDTLAFQGDLNTATGLGNMGNDYVSNNYIEANFHYVLGTSLTESGAGRLAGSFSTMHNVSAPFFTTASVNQTGDSFARIGATGSGLTSLASAANLATLTTNVSNILTNTLSESYAADGASFSVAQGLYMILAFLFESSAAGTVLTSRRLNGTTAMTFTLGDATDPSSITRAT